MTEQESRCRAANGERKVGAGHRSPVTNNIDNAWAPLATWLRQNKRQAINTETGGGNTASCQQFLCEQVAFQQQNSDGLSSDFWFLN